MRQAGILAAAAIYALDNNLERLTEDHANARLLAEGLNKLDGFDIDMSHVQTNIVIAEISVNGKDSQAVFETIKEAGVLAIPFGGTKLRFVTHLDVTEADCKKAVEIIAGLGL